MQISRARKRVPLFHVDEREEVRNLRSENLKRLANDMRIRTTFGHNEEAANISDVPYYGGWLYPTTFHNIVLVPRDGACQIFRVLGEHAQNGVRM